MIFPSTLIINPNPKQLETMFSKLGHTLEANNPDILTVSDNTIAAIRQINSFLSKKSYNHQNKIVYIPEIDKFHLEAQNALLKILEEPGTDNYFIITTNQPQKLLPTITSRCTTINTKTKSSSGGEPIFPRSDIKSNLELFDRIIAANPDIKTFLQQQLSFHQLELVKKPSLVQKNIVDKLIKSINLIEANVDPKSALDFFLLS